MDSSELEACQNCHAGQHQLPQPRLPSSFALTAVCTADLHTYLHNQLSCSTPAFDVSWNTNSIVKLFLKKSKFKKETTTTLLIPFIQNNPIRQYQNDIHSLALYLYGYYTTSLINYLHLIQSTASSLCKNHLIRLLNICVLSACELLAENHPKSIKF